MQQRNAYRVISQTYQELYARYGPQHWWPAQSRFEVMVGAILTQNTAWTNVEKAIANLNQHNLLSPHAILQAPMQHLATQLIPAGYFNIKAQRLRHYCQWYIQHSDKALCHVATDQLRCMLLAIKGIGPETADDMLLYAFDRPVFVVDAYTRRLLQRLDLITGKESYATLQQLMQTAIKPNVAMYQEYHALIVKHSKDLCRKRPLCSQCWLINRCAFGLATSKGIPS